jgi:hypothetical protein
MFQQCRQQHMAQVVSQHMALAVGCPGTVPPLILLSADLAAMKKAATQAAVAVDVLISTRWNMLGKQMACIGGEDNRD